MLNSSIYWFGFHYWFLILTLLIFIFFSLLLYGLVVFTAWIDTVLLFTHLVSFVYSSFGILNM